MTGFWKATVENVGSKPITLEEWNDLLQQLKDEWKKPPPDFAVIYPASMWKDVK
jgi:hypothetical protein